MTPDASDWRSRGGYEHVEDLTASDLAWEWLRRNESYDRDFRALMNAKSDAHPLTDAIRQRWGLRFPGQSVGCTSGSPRFLAPSGRYQRHRTRRGAPNSGRGR